jgi:hypothetical protein
MESLEAALAASWSCCPMPTSATTEESLGKLATARFRTWKNDTLHKAIFIAIVCQQDILW